MPSLFDVSTFERFFCRIAPWGLVLLLAIVPCQAGETADTHTIHEISPARTLDLVTDEGTWMSVDVSPDASTVVFDLLGDLYTVPLDGGTATPLTTGPAFESMPSYSPDGQWIAYVSDADGSENLWVVPTDGSSQPKQISAGEGHDFISPRWTPSGDRVMAARGKGGLHEIWSYDLETGESEPLLETGPRRENYLGAVYSPDARYLYYAQRRGSFSWDPRPPIWFVLRKDTTSGESDVLVHRPGSAFSPRISHNGELLVYGTRVDSETGLRLRNLKTGEERWLKYPVQRDDQEARASRDVLPGYAFTPDDREIVVSYDGKIRRVSVADGSVREVPFEAAVSLPLAPRPRVRTRVAEGPVRAHLVQWPDLSPDGTRLVFSALGHLYEADPQGDEPRRITDGETFEFQPVWSPDGRWIAYSTWSPDGGHLWKLRMDGQSEPEQISRVAGHYQDPVWTPDGSRLVAVFASTQARQEAPDGLSLPRPTDVVWVSADGGEPQRMTAANGARRPHFADDPERIYLSSGFGLLSIDFAGVGSDILVQVQGRGLRGPDSRAPASSVLLSPDGRHALALVNKDLYVVELPRPEAEATEEGQDPEGQEAKAPETIVADVAPLELFPTGDETPPTDPAETADDEPQIATRRISDLGADDYSWGEGGRTIVWSLGSTVYRKSLESVWDTEGDDENAGWSLDAVATKIDVEVPRDRPQGTLVLRGARLITMQGDSVIEDGVLVVQDNRIVAVGRRGEVVEPADAVVHDLGGKTIVPGFIDVHAHWHELMVGHIDRQAWPLWISLAHGLTTTRDPQSRTLDIFLYKDLIDSGEILGPRLYTTGPGWFANTPIGSYEDAERMARRFKEHYRTHMIKAYTTGDRYVRQWVSRASREVGLMATTEGAMDLKLDMTHAIDGFSGNEHNLPIAPIYDDVVQLFAQTKIFYTPTLVLSYGGPLGENYFFQTTNVRNDPRLRRFMPRGVLDSRTLRRSWYHPQEHIFPRHAETAAKIAAAGGKVCLGGHGQMQGIQAHWEMWALASGGMPSLEVLRSATLNGAEAIGLDRDLGSLEVGKLADLVILDHNPLDDIRNTLSIDSVMKNGRLYVADSLAQVWPETEILPNPWWWRDDPTLDPVMLAGGHGARLHETEATASKTEPALLDRSLRRTSRVASPQEGAADD